MPRKRLAVLGGTFDHLHVGHHALLATAFRVGSEVAIGLTTEQFLAAHPKPDRGKIEPYSRRRRRLVSWLRRNYPHRSWRVVPLENTFGRSVEPGVDVLVVSMETASGGRAVNRERRRLGRRPVPVVVVPLVLADDLVAVSSRRIRAGEVDRKGRRTSRFSVGLAAGRADRAAATHALRIVFPRGKIGTLSESTRRGRLGPVAHARAAASAALRGHELGVGVVSLGPGRWLVAVRSRGVELPPRRLEGSLEKELRNLLSPRLERNSF